MYHNSDNCRYFGNIPYIVWAIIVVVIIIPHKFSAGLILFLIHPQSYLVFDEKIKSPDGASWLALYHNYGGFGDPDWHVFKVPIDEIPEKLKIPCGYNFNDSAKSDFWKKRMLMWNWSEGGNNTSNPHIKMFNRKYLVFIRGGYYHGLYDIKKNQTLITDTSPWHSLVYSMDKNSRGSNLDQIDAKMDKWVEDTLHNPIKEIIEIDQTPNQLPDEIPSSDRFPTRR
jgi:hypothetical protein